MVGVVDRARLRREDGVRGGAAEDFEWMDLLDEHHRGGGHGPDHHYMVQTMQLFVIRAKRRSGYVYVDEHGRPALLAATDPETAQRLLWRALAASHGETLVNCITTGNHWAVDVGLEARLHIGQEGYLALRGMHEPAPYLANGQFL